MARTSLWRSIVGASALLLLLSFLPLSTASAQSINQNYDRQIKAAVDLYWSGLEDWRYLWAQLKQESSFNPKANSPVGAAGIAQFMPGTWKDIVRTMKYAQGSTPYQTELAIPAAAYYMFNQRNTWRGHGAARPEHDRWNLARASYNAGVKHILNAQKLCGDAVRYEPIIACLPRVTGPKNSQETIQYNVRINRYVEERKLAEIAGLTKLIQ